jgi:hypothetical protein
MIDRAFGGDDGDYEPDEAELEEIWLDNLEQEAATFPPADFTLECVPPRKPAGVQSWLDFGSVPVVPFAAKAGAEDWLEFERRSA